MNEDETHVTEDELVALLNELEQGLIEVGLPSLVEQERIVATEGTAEEPTAEDVEGVRQERALRGLKRFSRPRAGDVRIRPLDVSERLAHLLDLLEVAIGGSYAIEMNLRDDLKMALGDGFQQATVRPHHEWNGEIVFAIPAESGLAPTRRAEWGLPDQKALQVRGAAVRRAMPAGLGIWGCCPVLLFRLLLVFVRPGRCRW